MQNRSLIYIVCVVAFASLALLFIADQGLVVHTNPTVSHESGSNIHRESSSLDDSVIFDSSRHARVRSQLGTGHRDAVLPSQVGSSLRDDMKYSPNDGDALSLGAVDLSHDLSFPNAAMQPDGWSRVEDLEIRDRYDHQWNSQSVDRHSPDFSWQTDVAGDVQEQSRVTESFEKRLSSGFNGWSSERFGGEVASDLTGFDTDVVTARVEEDRVRSGAESDRVSMIDRPEIRDVSIRNLSVGSGAMQNASTIMQVQNQEPATSSETAEEEGEAQQLGVPPPKETPAFLKKRSILLEPGQYQFEYGLRYSVDNNAYTLTGLLQEGTSTVQVVNANRKKQLVSTPLEFRVGLKENLQGFVTLPLGWSAQSLTAGGSQQASDIFGIGDLGIGVTRVMWAPEKSKTRFLGFIQASAPIGDGEISLSQQERDASLGAGYWTLTTGGNVTESIDPLVLFGSFGYTHTFGTRISSGNYVDVGNTIFYQVGVGYGINPYVTLSGSFSGASSGQVRLDDVVAVGTRTEPFSLRLSASVNKPDEEGRSRLGTKYEPFLRFGLTGLANDVEFGVRWTY